jgi:hypothetical protein
MSKFRRIVAAIFLSAALLATAGSAAAAPTSTHSTAQPAKDWW